MIFRWIGYAVLCIISAAILAVAGLLAFFMTDREIPVVVLSTEVLTPTVKPGDKLVIRQRVRYTRDCGGHVDRALYDAVSSRQYLTDVDYERPPRGLGDFWLKFEETVPASFAAGEAQYRATPSYHCNPLQKYYWPITREDTVLKFKIEPP